jgi:hypothetical protein
VIGSTYAEIDERAGLDATAIHHPPTSSRSPYSSSPTSDSSHDNADKH